MPQSLERRRELYATDPTYKKRQSDNSRKYRSKPENTNIARKRAREWTLANPERAADRLRQWSARNPEKYRNNRYYSIYGITLADKAAMLEAQGGACAICRTTTPNGAWHTDHDHATGFIRGILCRHCNTMLGMAKDTASVLVAAAHYLNLAESMQ